MTTEPSQIWTDLVHELNTPLTVIRGEAQLARRLLLRRDDPELSPVVVRLATIEQATLALAAKLAEVEQMALSDLPDRTVPHSPTTRRRATDRVRRQ